MKRTSASKGNGAICIGPSIAMGIWLIPCRAEKRDREAAKRFFKQAVDVVGHAPERVTTDGHDSSPRAIRQTLGHERIHRCNRSLSTTASSKITVASNNAITRCAALERSSLRLASAEPLMNYATPSVPAI